MSSAQMLEWPYKFCGVCRILSPIKEYTVAKTKVPIIRCVVCENVVPERVGGKTVMLSQEEAEARGLRVME